MSTPGNTPRRRSVIDKLLNRNATQNATKNATLDPETQSTTGLINSSPSQPHTSGTRTITLPLTGGGSETLVIPDDQPPRLPSSSDGDNAPWKYRHGARKASIPASDTGEKTVHASDVEKAQYLSLMAQTRGMSGAELKEFLAKRGSVDGGKVMRRWEEGKTGEGYMQVVGADSGTM